MGKVIGFIKGNLVIVISVVLILAFLPTGYVFADKWNTKVREEADAAYKKEKRALTSKGTIEYSVPAVLTSERDLSESRAPNRNRGYNRDAFGLSAQASETQCGITA